MLNLDTHIVLFMIAGGLRTEERALLEQETWSISAIVLWQLAKLVQLGRIDFDFDDSEVIRVLDLPHVWPITEAVARASARLDFRSDPADELIAATSVVHGVPLLTRDRVMLGSNVVPLSR
jgi:PIN domain nuclease of toxin-antitoxin system